MTRMPLLLLLLLAAALSAACHPPETGAPEARALSVSAPPGSALPRLSPGPGGALWLSWVAPEGEGHVLAWAPLEPDGFGPGRVVARGEDWFVNWADFPSVVPLGEGRAAAHWLVKRPGGTYAYDVAMATSTDGGLTWGPAFSPHDDGTATEHGFVSLYPAGDGLGAVWLDGRNMTAGDGAGHDGHGGGAMTLRHARVAMDGSVAGGAELDGMVCDCCQTSAVMTATGPLVAYRDRTPDEVRDHMLLRADDGGWGEPVALGDEGWVMAACPVNGPALDRAGDTVAAAWFTAAGGEPRVRAALSIDGGARFGAPVEIDAGAVIGRVDVAVVGPGAAVVSWLAAAGDEGEIRYRRLDEDGAGPVRSLARTGAQRSSGFPQLAAGGDGLVFAWTVPGDPSGIAAATVPAP